MESESIFEYLLTHRLSPMVLCYMHITQLQVAFLADDVFKVIIKINDHDVAEILTIQKFTTLSSCNQHLVKIYGSFVVCVTRTQQAIMRDHDLHLSS